MIKRKNFLPFHKPAIGQKEIKAVIETLKSGWLTTGPKAREFEEKFKKFIGVKYAIAVNSCTAALHLALAVIGLKEGDEVIVPTMTFASTAQVVSYFKAKPVFIDCEPSTLLINPAKIEEKITQKTKAIIPVHYGGQPCDIDEILKIAKANKLKVIWDAAHALPSFYKGKLVGNFPDITCFSFYANKPLACGEGGMVTTNNKKYAEKIRILSYCGMKRIPWEREKGNNSWSYQIIAPGFKYNLPDVLASIGLGQLKKCLSLWKKRKKISQDYARAFQNLKEIRVLEQKPERQNSWYLYVIKLVPNKLKISRDKFVEELRKRNIGTSVHYTPLHLHSFWKKTYNLKPEDFPIAAKSSQQIISLPIFPDMTKNDVLDVVSAVKDIVKKFRK